MLAAMGTMGEWNEVKTRARMTKTFEIDASDREMDAYTTLITVRNPTFTGSFPG